MLRPPAFWRSGGGTLMPLLLSPLAAVTAAITAKRVVQAGWRAPVPVICCGNVTVGGAGKTTLAIDLGRRLLARGRHVHFLSRGYGGSGRGTHRVALGESAGQVGDEPLLLAETAPTWTGADRAASARAAVEAGAQVLVLDDGLQNPTLCKDLSLLVVDGATGFGNGHVLPAGPLREPVSVGASRCQAIVLIEPDLTGALAYLPPGMPRMRARLAHGPEVNALAGRKVFAFAGIASPDKFFATLAATGTVVVGRVPFRDHHPYTEREVQRLLTAAARLHALPVTTAKDAVRLPPALAAQVRVADVGIAWEDPAAIEALLSRLFPG
jgi:tetraacyldisaccharide 4'-kinase